jgi:4'-phosphopantetheinyl transferase
MSLLLHRHLAPEGELGIWKIEEEEAFFFERLDLYPEEKEQIEGMKGRRRLEWLAGRYLLHYMSGREVRGACLIDEFGKPHLENSLFQISLSHSHELVAIMAAPLAVGVDIQYLVEKIGRIADKFLRPEESASISDGTRLEHLHVYWGAKEALYKAYGRRELDFRENLFVNPFEFSARGGRTTGWIRKNSFQMEMEVFYEQREGYVLVWARENK